MTPRNILLLTVLLTVLLAALQLLQVTGALAYSGSWLVVEDSHTGACYRMTELPDGKNWVKLGAFDTFRQAGMWTWEHRDVCKSSPVFH